MTNATKFSLPRPPKVIIFDFDGVILDSAGLKLSAYPKVYANEDAAKVEAVVRHAEYHGGITRRVKFEHYEREIFGRKADAASVDALCQRYFDIVYAEVLRCPFIDGAYDLLEHAAGKVRMHVISGTPDSELNQVVRERGLARYFVTVRGAPATKRERFGEIVAEEGCRPDEALAIGDSMTEFEAARDGGIPFLGIVPPGLDNPFPAATPVWESLSRAGDRLAIG
ncbi:MAG: HAD family hydrolase [Pseudolabrys sp.]|nr:HAD family hydrolase [Pseudolabrys sp.]